jgi:hypothetical protein
MITKLFFASIAAAAAFAATVPAHALITGNGQSTNGTSVNGLEAQGIDPNGIDPNGIDPNGIDPNGIDPNGIDPNGIDPNGTQLVGADAGNLDSEDPRVSAQPQSLFSIDGAIVPQ